jgi:hypothetical protein
MGAGAQFNEARIPACAGTTRIDFYIILGSFSGNTTSEDR